MASIRAEAALSHERLSVQSSTGVSRCKVEPLHVLSAAV